MKSTEKTLLALTVGLGLGAVLGILFAPAKGTDTRKKIKGGIDQCRSKVNELVDEFKEMVAAKEQQIIDAIEEEEEEQRA